MTEYQILYLRFLRMKADFPELRHDGHEPSAGVMSTLPETPEGRIRYPSVWDSRAEVQRREVEREFYRPVERSTRNEKRLTSTEF